MQFEENYSAQKNIYMNLKKKRVMQHLFFICKLMLNG